MFDPALTIRAANVSDSRTLARLALHDGRSRPVAGSALLAERDGVPLAAIALTSGIVLPNPSTDPGDPTRLLRLIRYRIMRQGGNTGAARSLLSRANKGNNHASLQAAAAPRSRPAAR